MQDFMKVITLRAVYEACSEGQLPQYLGSTVRGILGHCIREFVCDIPHLRCFKCDKRQQCLYVRCFSNTGGQVGAVNPFVLNVHTQGKTEWRRGDLCTFDLTLFGTMESLAHIYMDALLDMERKGWGAQRLTFKLVSVTEPDTGCVIYAGGKTWLRNLQPHPMKLEERKAGAALIRFDTPLRIVSGGELVHDLTFDILCRFLYKRLERLAHEYWEMELPWNEDELMERASGINRYVQNWKEIEFSRYSMNQMDNRVELPSRMGEVLYEGELTGFTTFLQAGAYVHIGKGATIGFGHYEAAFDR